MFVPEKLLDVFTNNSDTNTTAAQDWTEVYEAIRWIQFVMALLSVLGSGSVIVCVMLQRLSRMPELQPLFLLSVSDLLLALCWLIGAALFSHRCSSLNTHCYHLHTVEQTLYMASFFYTLNYVWNLHTGIRDKFYSCINGYVQFSNRVSTTAKVTALLSGLLPVMLMMPVFIQGTISQCQANFSEPYRCLLMHTGALFLTSQHHQPIRACRQLHTYRIAIFLATFFLTLLSIVVLVVKARRIYRRVVTSHGYLGNQQRASFSVIDRRMLLYPLIFILCWGPAVGVALLRALKPAAGQGEVGVALYITQVSVQQDGGAAGGNGPVVSTKLRYEHGRSALTSASQGFLNCLVYGWTRAQFRRASGRVFSQDADTQTPLLRSQKKRGYQTLCTVG